jgi:hypothetical protein
VELWITCSSPFISAARLKITVQRLQERLQTIPPDLRELLEQIKEARDNQRSRYIQWLTVSRGSDFNLVTIGEIRFLRADNKYTILYTAPRICTVVLDGTDPDSSCVHSRDATEYSILSNPKSLILTCG